MLSEVVCASFPVVGLHRSSDNHDIDNCVNEHNIPCIGNTSDIDNHNLKNKMIMKAALDHIRQQKNNYFLIGVIDPRLTDNMIHRVGAPLSLSGSR